MRMSETNMVIAEMCWSEQGRDLVGPAGSSAKLDSDSVLHTLRRETRRVSVTSAVIWPRRIAQQKSGAYARQHPASDAAHARARARDLTDPPPVYNATGGPPKRSTRRHSLRAVPCAHYRAR